MVRIKVLAFDYIVDNQAWITKCENGNNQAKNNFDDCFVLMDLIFDYSIFTVIIIEFNVSEPKFKGLCACHDKEEVHNRDFNPC
jgi:hypothetical protein